TIFGEPDVERLWELLAFTVRLDEPDPVAAWREHLDRLTARAATLNERRFHTSWGREHVPNMPTEEVYVAPDFRRTEGVVRSTRPLALLGQLVEGLELRFQGGKIVDVR